MNSKDIIDNKAIDKNSITHIDAPRDIADPNWLGFKIMTFKAFLRNIFKGRLSKF